MQTKVILGLVFCFLFATKCLALDTNRHEGTTYTEEETSIVLSRHHPRFVIKLKSNPTTGYSWFLREYHSFLILPLNHQFVPAEDKKLMGAPGFDVWTFQATPKAFVAPQQTVLRFVYTRPWEKQDSSEKVLVFRVSTTP